MLSDRTVVASGSILRAHAWLRGAPRVAPEDLFALRYLLGARLAPEALSELLASEVFHDDVEVPPRSAVARSGESGTGETGASRVLVPHRAATRRRDLELFAAAGDLAAPAKVESLEDCFGGPRSRGGAELREHPGGMPRSYRAWRRGDRFEDADPFELIRFAAGELPAGPRVTRRARRDGGGAILLLRDVSASMEGRLGRWAGQAVAGIVSVAARKRMRIAYAEFSDETTLFEVEGRLFHRRYFELLRVASRRHASGQTTLSGPLGSVVEAFTRQPRGEGRHVVLLTDGLPVLGDPELRQERGRLRENHIRVHPVFLGLGPCPPLLDQLAEETDGVRLAPRPSPDGSLELVGPEFLERSRLRRPAS